MHDIEALFERAFADLAEDMKALNKSMEAFVETLARLSGRRKRWIATIARTADAVYFGPLEERWV